MWKKVKLGEICEIIAGQSPSSSTYNQEGNGVPFFQGKADFGYINPTVRFWCMSPIKMSQPNDILFSLRAPVGPTNINNVKACIGRGLAAIRVSNEINLNFLLQFLRANEKEIAQLGTGSTFKAITIGVLKDLEIPLPPLQIQERIAEILDKADELRRKDKDLQEKYDQLAQAIFIDMFGDPVKNEKGWEVRDLSEILEINCVSIDPTKLESYNYIGLEHIEKKSGYILGISKEVLKSTKFRFNEKHILFGKLRPYLNKVANPNFEGICSTDIYPILPFDDKFKTFLIFILRSDYFINHVNSMAVGANLPRATKSSILNFKTIFPPIHLQEEFAKKIELINELKSKINAEKSEELFQSLLQKAFKGELVS